MIIQILVVQVNGADLAIFIGGVVVNTCTRIAAGGIDRFFKMVSHFDTAFLLGDGSQNMKKLIYSV